jgi:chemotaxis protein histidine kinase CheA
MALDIKKFVMRFVEEAREHIARLGEGLDALERDPADREIINTIFRSAHTIKGSSRMLKLNTITDTAHKMEDVLGVMRDGGLPYTPALGQVLYRGVDAIAALVERLAAGEELPAVDEALCAELALAAKDDVGWAHPPGARTSARRPGAHAKITSADRVGRACAVGDLSPYSHGLLLAGTNSVPTLPDVAEAAPAPEARLKAPDTVRVRLNKLDELIKLMGEVVSSHARSRQRLLDVRELERTALAATDRDGIEHIRFKKNLHHFSQTLRDDVLAQELLMDELHGKALTMRMLPLSIVFDSVGRMMREMAHSLGKDVECIVSGAEIELDRQIIDKLSDPIIHLLRNAVDHGLETPAERQAAGKPARGKITLSARQDGGCVVIEITDDGGGIAVEAVREKALRKGFLSAENASAMNEREIIDLIFLPGFSTSSIITDISGRGVGMDVVKRCIVDDLQGVISVDTRLGAGATFALRLPLSLAVMRVLLVEVAGVAFGFTAQYVAELLRVAESEFMNVAERRAITIRNEFVPVIALNDMLQIPPQHARKTAQNNRHDGVLLLVVRVRSEKLALVVDDLLDEHDMVIKSMPEHMRKLSMISGMVTTGKNELVNILHVPVLLEMARNARGDKKPSGLAAESAARVFRVLVVDDSLNTREIEKDVLEAHGYQITLAEDGLDGLRKAQSGDFDAVLTDVEMPNMDGFTLTEQLRQDEKYRDKPIIIITSREKEEDKRRGIQVGADAYIVKGDFSQSNLVETLRNLLG